MVAQAIPMPTSTEVHPLRVLRAQRGWKQSDLAKSAGVSLRTIVAIERRSYSPRMPVRKKLLAALGLALEQHGEVFGEMPRTARWDQ